MPRPASRHLPVAVVAIAALSASAVAVTGASGATTAPDQGPVACHVLPDAAALGTDRGRTISTLHPYDGKIFYGYGDYNANTGSLGLPYGTNVSYLDPVDGSTHVALAGFKTEEVNTFRTLGGRLHVPNIDPSRGADSDNSFASDTDGAWAENPGAAGPVHVYDVTKAGGQLFVVGSAAIPSPVGAVHGAAVVWRSTDNGSTWERSRVETETDVALRTGYERYYWAGAIGDKVYTRAALNTVWPEIPPLNVLDTTTNTWSTVPDPDNRFGMNVYEAHDVVAWRDRLWSAGGNLRWFDGTQTVAVTDAQLNANVTHLSVSDDDQLYAMTGTGAVFRIELPAATAPTTPTPTVSPTPEPTAEPTAEPTVSPTAKPKQVNNGKDADEKTKKTKKAKQTKRSSKKKKQQRLRRNEWLSKIKVLKVKDRQLAAARVATTPDLTVTPAASLPAGTQAFTVTAGTVWAGGIYGQAQVCSHPLNP